MPGFSTLTEKPSSRVGFFICSVKTGAVREIAPNGTLTSSPAVRLGQSLSKQRRASSDYSAQRLIVSQQRDFFNEGSNARGAYGLPFSSSCLIFVARRADFLQYLVNGHNCCKIFIQTCARRASGRGASQHS
jgi:hypothetical protein